MELLNPRGLQVSQIDEREGEEGQSIYFRLSKLSLRALHLYFITYLPFFALLDRCQTFN